MAEAIVGSAVNWLGNLLVEETEYLYGVEDKVKQLQSELKWMQCFLQDMDANRNNDARMREWVTDINCLAYRAEDIIESFILRVDLQRHGGLMKKLKRFSCILREAMALREVGSDIDELKTEISTLTSRLQTYGVQITKRDGSSTGLDVDLRRSYAHVQEENIIGLEKDVEKVVQQLLNNKADSCRIVSLCGMGGLGKTTLAKVIYHHKQVRQHFDAFAWAYISQECQTKSVLIELFQALTSGEGGSKMTVAQLMAQLHKVQSEKNCLVVLDDIWRSDAWDSLKAAFPNHGDASGGKLLLTTRNESAVQYIDDKAYIHKQRTLNKGDAWHLLKAKLRYDPSTMFGQEHGPGMEKLGMEMLELCGGLPLAIVALGGVLSRKKSIDQWQAVHMNTISYLASAREGGLSYKEVLELSYNDLPYYLRPCFLYFGIFPEDAEIPTNTLMQLWMAEGLVSSPHANDEEDIYVFARQQQGTNIVENIAEGYLLELVDRSMVQMGSTRTNGKIKTLRIHDLMRDLCLSKAAEENFLKVVKGGRQGVGISTKRPVASTSIPLPSPSYMFQPNNITRKRYRRLAIHGEEGWNKFVASNPGSKSKTNNASHLKSLFTTTGASYVEASESCSASAMGKAIKQFPLLRVLDLRHTRIQYLANEIGNLVHLRYLSIRGSPITEVPSSVGNLRCLQTLDLRSSLAMRMVIPNVLWRMKRLRHLYLPELYYLENRNARIRTALLRSILPFMKLQLDGLKDLEILCNHPETHRMEDIIHLNNLRKFSVIRLLDTKHLELIRNSQSLLCGHLKDLSFSITEEALIEKPKALLCFSSLNKLKLSIVSEMFKTSSSQRSNMPLLPTSLTRLEMWGTTGFDSDPMKNLEKLPNLKQLSLYYSYRGKKMICSRGGFPKLTYLVVHFLGFLEEWVIEEGAMQSLQHLEIDRCTKLKMIPEGIKFIHSLQDLKIGQMPKSFCDRVRASTMKSAVVDGNDEEAITQSEGVDVYKVRHIPTIQFVNENTNAVCWRMPRQRLLLPDMC